jgi:hypothetical protein
MGNVKRKFARPKPRERLGPRREEEGEWKNVVE